MGGDDREGWSGERGSSDATFDTELELGKEEPALLTASPWDAQESGARGLRRGGRAGGSGSRKVTSGTADGRETWSRHGPQTQQGGKKEAAGVGSVHTPGEWGGTLRAARPPEWAHSCGVEWEEGGREAY